MSILGFESPSKSLHVSDTSLTSQAKGAKIKRVYVSCFNVSPEFADTFHFPKIRNGGDWKINYLAASFNKEAECGEFFIEFDDQVYEDKLIECFEALGAGEVCTVTFKHNDGDDSAANALLRVYGLKEEPEVKRGKCPEYLEKVLRRKQQEEADKKKYYTSQEWDEKTGNAKEQSLLDVKVKIEGVNSTVTKIDNAVEDMQTRVIKIDDVQSDVAKIGTYVSNQIPEIEKRLASETKQKYENMGRLGPLQRRINLLESRNKELEKTVQDLRDENQQLNSTLVKYTAKEQSWIREKDEFFTMQNLISSVQRASQMSSDVLASLQHTSAMNASILESNSTINEEIQRTADILASTLEEERAAKRARV